MSKETELSDEQIEKIAKTYIRSVGGYSCSEDAIPDNGKIEDFARAIIAADRAQQIAEPASGWLDSFISERRRSSWNSELHAHEAAAINLFLDELEKARKAANDA